MGLSPFEAPATFSMMPYTELAHGVWYPKGGMHRVVEALMEIASAAGVEFIYDANVGRIDVSGEKARGVMLADGRRLECGRHSRECRSALCLSRFASTRCNG